MKIEISARSDQIRKACIELEKQLRKWGLPENTVQEIVLAFDEALTNIMLHGYKPWKDNNQNKIYVEVYFKANKVSVELRDWAGEYSVEVEKISDMDEYLKSERVGGFGLSIIKKIMDKVEVQRKDNSNSLSLVKHIKEIPEDGSIVITTRTSEAWVMNKVLHVNTLPGSYIGISDAKQNVRAYEDMINRYPQKMVYAKIINQINLKGISREAVKYYLMHEVSHIRAIALIRGNFIKRLIMNLLFFRNRKFRAVKMFKNTDKALKWLENISYGQFFSSSISP